MKQLIFLLFFIFSCIAFVSASGDKRLEFRITELHYHEGFYPRLPWAEVLLELKNKTTDTLFFLSNTCSNFGLYNIEGEGTTYSITECDISNPMFIVIPPQSIYHDTITVGHFYLKKAKSFRVKINLVEPKEKSDPEKAKQETDSKKFSIYTDSIKVDFTDEKFLEFSGTISEKNTGGARVALELKNLSSDTLAFLTNQSKSWLYDIEGGQVFFIKVLCNVCIPTFIKIAPGSIYRDSISIDYIKVPPFSFRVKINLVEPKEKYDPYKASKETDSKKFSLFTDYIKID